MSPHTDAGALLKLAEAEGVKRFPPKDPGDMGVDLNKWSRECFVEGFIAARQAASHGSAGGEIERCAKIADAESDSWIKGEATTAVGQSFQRACRQIALKIRALSPPVKTGDPQ